MKKALFFFLTTLCLVFIPKQVFAQETREALVIDTVRYEQETQDLIREYQDTLRSYDARYSEFRLAKAEYEQLQTLTALERAIQASREFFVARDEVLLRYTKLLRIKLYQSFGIFFDTKREKIAVLDAVIIDLEAHLEASKKIETRDDVIEQTLNFFPITEGLQAETDLIVPLFTIGKLQSTFDRVITLTDDVEADIANQDLTVAKKAEKERALDLVREKESELENVLSEINGPVRTDEHGNIIESKYDANTVYARLSQILSFLGEVIE